MNFIKKNYKYFIYAFIVISAFLLDQVSKEIVENNIALNSSVNVIDNFFRLTYIHNTGAAFGIFSGRLLYLILFSILVIFFILYQFISYKDSKFVCSSFALLLGGLLGNLVDRISLGYVRDFIDFQIFKYDAPIFNISDIFICVSVCMLVVAITYYEGGVLNENNSNGRRQRQKTRQLSSGKNKQKQE